MTGRERTNKKVQEDELGKDENTNVFGRCAAFMSQMLTVNSCCSLEIKTNGLPISFSSHGNTNDFGCSDGVHPEGKCSRIYVLLKERI